MCDLKSVDYLRKIGLPVGAPRHAVTAATFSSTVGAALETAGKMCAPNSLRVLTFNVLFPNSESSGVWWIYKYYDADASDTTTGHVDVTDWCYRAVLLRRLVERADAHIVCFQEPWNCRGTPKLPSGCAPSSSKSGEEDVVQAVFKSDFAFMEELGYKGELLGKGAIRPATFWKSGGSSVPQWISSSHKVNRALVSLFEVSLGETSDAHSTLISKKQLLAVVNCHLTADPTKAKDRLSNVEDAVKVAGKLLGDAAKPTTGNAPKGKKGKSDEKESAASSGAASVIVCGDFNSNGGLLDTFLTAGEVGPDDTIGLKRKAHALAKFVDCGKSNGPTLVVPNIDTQMVRPIQERTPLSADLAEEAQKLQDILQKATGRCDESGEVRVASASASAELMRAVNEQVLTPQMLVQLQKCFDRLRATPSGPVEGRILAENEISGTQVNWWLRSVNKELGRGTEFRRAREIQFAKATDASVDADLLPPLTFDEFVTVWRLECEEGKYWSIEHDLQKLCGSGMRKAGDLSYQEAFDHMYMSSSCPGGLRLASADVVAFFPRAAGGEDDKLKSLADLGLAAGSIDSFVLPNEWHPSDHLPILAEFIL